MLRVGAATMAHAEKDGGKAKTTPGKYRELEAQIKGQRNYAIVLKELDK